MSKREKEVLLSIIASCRAAVRCWHQSAALEHLASIEKCVVNSNSDSDECSEEELEDWSANIESKINHLEKRVAYLEWINCLGEDRVHKF